jgi:hypothetical protein
LGHKITYVGTSEHKSAEDKLEIAQNLGAQEESTNTSKTPLQRLRYVLEKVCDGSHGWDAQQEQEDCCAREGEKRKGLKSVNHKIKQQLFCPSAPRLVLAFN